MSDRDRRGKNSEDLRESSQDQESVIDRLPPNSRVDNPGRRKKRWWFLLGFLILILMLPNLVGWMGFHQSAINYGLSSYPVKVSVDSFSAGWFQSVKLNGVTVKDDRGDTLVQVAEVQTANSLWQLLAGRYGKVILIQPELFLHLKKDGSNVEDVLAKINSAPKDAASTPEDGTLPTLQIEIQSGRALVTSDSSSGRWRCENLHGELQTQTSEAPLLFGIQTDVTPERMDQNGEHTLATPGSLAIAGQLDSGSSHLTGNTADVLLQMDQLPLSALGPCLERWLGPTATSGRANGKLTAYMRGDEQSVSVSFDRFQLNDLALLSPALIGKDQLDVETLTSNGKLQLTPRLIHASEFVLESNMGKASADGEFDLQQLSQFAQQGKLSNSSFKMSGNLDLGQLIRMLPETFRLQEDLEVVAGEVSFLVNSHAKDELTGTGKRIVANLDTANLRATRNGRELVWAKPIRLVGTVSESNGELQIQDLQCLSEFLNLRGKGSLRSASFEVDGNLQNLTNRLQQFFNLEQVELAGTFAGKFGWKVPEGSPVNLQNTLNDLPFQLGGQIDFQQPRVAWPGMPDWGTENLVLKLSSNGKALKSPDSEKSANSMGESYQLNLEQAGLQIDIGNETAILTLSEPVQNVLVNQRYLATGQVTGQLSRWKSHLGRLVDLDSFSLAGDIDLVAALTIDPDAIQFQANEYQVNDFAFTGFGTTIAEPKVDGNAQGRFEFTDASVTFDDLTVIATSISARGRNVRIAYPSNLRLDGDIAYRANVSRVANWFELSTSADDVFWFGNAEGQARLKSDDQGIQIETDSTIRDFVAATQTLVQGQPSGPIVQASNPVRQWTSAWQEDELTVRGSIKLANDFDSLTMRDVNIGSNAVSAKIDGTIAEISSRMLLDIRGNWSPDWAKIQQLVSHYAGDAVQFEGGKKQTFQVKGPLFSANESQDSIVAQSAPVVPLQLAGTTNFGWQHGALLGLPVGASQLDVSLENGIAQVTTHGIPFAGGQVKFAPIVDLRSSEPVVKMEWTRLVENVELKPDTARKWLRYVAPLAAEATSAQGQFTIDIGEANIPIYQPQTIQARGAVRLSNVVIGAGPAAQQLLASAKQIRQLLKPGATEKDLNTWMRLKEQTVPIVVRDGRVYHEQLDFSHNDLTIRTKGSVGFDQSLHMVAEIPIADDWIDGTRYLDSLKGKSLKLPLKGTVSEPRLDTSAIEQLSRDLVKQAAQQAVDKAVKNKLNPKLNEFQQKWNDRINGKLNQFQQDLNDKLNLDKIGLGSSGQKNGEAGGGFLPQSGKLLPDPKELIPKFLQKQK